MAITDYQKYITIDDFAYELRDGKDGIDGIGANGTKKILLFCRKFEKKEDWTLQKEHFVL